MTELTLPPWEKGIENNRIRIWAVTPSAVRYGIADICMNRTTNEPGPSLAEREIANLIAAAPDLLTALYFVRDHLAMLTVNHKLGKDKYMIAAKKRIRAAIAKAHNT